VAYHGDFGKPSDHICYWSVWTETANERAAAIELKHTRVSLSARVRHQPLRESAPRLDRRVQLRGNIEFRIRRKQRRSIE
jgi:hypothetical protein